MVRIPLYVAGFVKNDLCWSKLGSEPSWPAEIYSFSKDGGVDQVDFVKSRGTSFWMGCHKSIPQDVRDGMFTMQACVMWLGDEQHSWMPVKKLELFEDKFAERYQPKRSAKNGV